MRRRSNINNHHYDNFSISEQSDCPWHQRRWISGQTFHNYRHFLLLNMTTVDDDRKSDAVADKIRKSLSSKLLRMSVTELNLELNETEMSLLKLTGDDSDTNNVHVGEESDIQVLESGSEYTREKRRRFLYAALQTDKPIRSPLCCVWKQSNFTSYSSRHCISVWDNAWILLPPKTSHYR